jgi:predicted neuraminidase
VHALLRSTEGRALRSSSADGGRTWGVASATGMPHNNSGLTVVGLGDGRVACVHNPVSGDWGARCPLVVSVSDDDGAAWREVVTLDDGRTPVDDDPRLEPSRRSTGFAPADDGVATDGTGEYSYPAAVLDDDALLVTYTWQRRGVVEARVPLDLLRAA